MKAFAALLAIAVLLIVQPVLLHAETLELGYSTYLWGHLGDTCGYGITLGSGGEAYVTGWTSALYFPTSNPYQASLNGDGFVVTEDAFVSKLSSSGSALIYSTFLGGSAYDEGDAIALGTDGEAYVVGWTYSVDFPTSNPYQASLAGVCNAFVSRLSSSGSSLIYSTYLGGSGRDHGSGITLRTDGEAYVSGTTGSLYDFPTLNPYQANYGGGEEDAFVSRLSSSGSSLIYSTYLGGSDSDGSSGITLGTGGEAYVAGYTASTDLPTLNACQASNRGSDDAFVSRLSFSGSLLIYSTYLGGSSRDRGAGITLGTGGEAYIAGYTCSTDFPTLNAYQVSFNGDGEVGIVDAFVSKLASSGSSLIYSTYLGATFDDSGDGISLGTGGEAYVTGRAGGWDFPTLNPYQASSNGGNIFVSRFSSSGSSLIYSTYLGGSGGDYGRGITLGRGGEAYVVGQTSSVDFPTLNPYQANGSGYHDAFVSKLIFAATPASANFIIDSGDYDGDGTSDIGIFRPSQGKWAIRNVLTVYLGGSGDTPVSADYNGDGTTDIAIFRDASGLWSVRNLTRFYLGGTDDQPVPGDYSSDGTAEVGIFRETSGLWSIPNLTRAFFGSLYDVAIPGFYNGDDVKDIAIFRGSTGMWSVMNITRFYFGASSDALVPGDYNGMGKWEAGIFRLSSGMWSIRNVTRIYLGGSDDWALPADYNCDGIDEAGIFRDSAGMWSVRNLTRAYFGSTGDIPVTR